jgi:hypothetical protein
MKLMDWLIFVSIIFLVIESGRFTIFGERGGAAGVSPILFGQVFPSSSVMIGYPFIYSIPAVRIILAWATIVVRVCRASPPTLLYSHSFRLSMFHCSVIVRCVSAVYRAIVGNLRDWQKGRYTHKRAHNWLFSFTLLTFLLLLFQSFFSSSPLTFQLASIDFTFLLTWKECLQDQKRWPNRGCGHTGQQAFFLKKKREKDKIPLELFTPTHFGLYLLHLEFCFLISIQLHTEYG